MPGLSMSSRFRLLRWPCHTGRSSMSKNDGRRLAPESDETERVFRQLCHLLSLDRDGKVQGAIESLVMTVLYIDPEVGAQADPSELALAIATSFGVEIDVGGVKSAVEGKLKRGGL